MLYTHISCTFFHHFLQKSASTHPSTFLEQDNSSAIHRGKPARRRSTSAAILTSSVCDNMVSHSAGHDILDNFWSRHLAGLIKVKRKPRIHKHTRRSQTQSHDRHWPQLLVIEFARPNPWAHESTSGAGLEDFRGRKKLSAMANERFDIEQAFAYCSSVLRQDPKRWSSS